MCIQDVFLKHDLISSSPRAVIILVVTFDLATKIMPPITNVKVHRLHTGYSYLPPRGKHSERWPIPSHQNDSLIRGKTKQNKINPYEISQALGRLNIRGSPLFQRIVVFNFIIFRYWRLNRGLHSYGVDVNNLEGSVLSLFSWDRHVINWGTNSFIPQRFFKHLGCLESHSAGRDTWEVKNKTV